MSCELHGTFTIEVQTKQIKSRGKRGMLLWGDNGPHMSLCIDKQQRKSLSLSGGFTLFSRFVHEGKISIRFHSTGILLMISDAPSEALFPFATFLGRYKPVQNAPPQRAGGGCKAAAGAAKRGRESTGLTHSVLGVHLPKPTALLSAAHASSFTNRSTAAAGFTTKLGAKGAAKGPSFSPEQQAAIKLACESRESMFITGGAGVGKTMLLSAIIRQLRAKNDKGTFVTGSTSIAACNIGGTTLHQFSGLSVDDLKLPPKERLRKLRGRFGVLARWKQCKTLVIDEVSMIDAQFFDHVDFVARHLREKDAPFGGIQLIVCGWVRAARSPHTRPTHFAARRTLFSAHTLYLHYCAHTLLTLPRSALWLLQRLFPAASGEQRGLRPGRRDHWRWQRERQWQRER